MWYMIYDNRSYNNLYNVWYDKEQYMTYNMEVWYADMIYHMTWYMIHTII